MNLNTSFSKLSMVYFYGVEDFTTIYCILERGRRKKLASGPYKAVNIKRMSNKQNNVYELFEE